MTTVDPPAREGEPARPAADSQEETREEAHPRGTLFLMLVFLIMIIAFWGYLYVVMLERS